MDNKNNLADKETEEFSSLEAALSDSNADWSSYFGHKTVLKTEAVESLNIKENAIYVDGTLGGGGHSRLILNYLGAGGKLIAFDKDPEPIKWAKEGWAKNENRIKFIQDDFVNFKPYLEELDIYKVDGFLLDLGLNSRQLLNPGRGFSCLNDDPLDMRMNPDEMLTAWNVVNEYSEKNLADVLYKYGEVRASRRVARGIVWAREKKPIESASKLAKIISGSLYRPGARPKIHPATQSFMAIRIEVNKELNTLEKFLIEVPKVLNKEARVSIITFHSLEDRIVKHNFRDNKNIWQLLNKKPILPSVEELENNSRARSAKLRFAEFKGNEDL